MAGASHPSSFTVRRATPGVVGAIGSIGLLTWPATYLDLTGPDFVMDNLATWWTEESVRASISGDITFVACGGARVVGTVTVGN